MIIGGKSRKRARYKGARYYKCVLRGNYFIFGIQIRLHARYYIRFLREKFTFGGKSRGRKRARCYKRVLRGNYFILGPQIRLHARYYRRVFREKVSGGKVENVCSRYYKCVLRGKVTFGTLISRSKH